MLFTTIGDCVGLKLKTILTTNMGKLSLNGLTGRIISLKPLSNHVFHDRNIPDIPEKAVHVDNVFQSKTYKRQFSFHVIKSAVDLIFNRSTDISDAIAQKAIIACFYDTCVRPLFVDVVSFDHKNPP